MNLDPVELKRLTQRTRWTAQARVLRALGIPYKVRPEGTLLVMVADVAGQGAAQAVSATGVQPGYNNFANLNRRLRSTGAHATVKASKGVKP